MNFASLRGKGGGGGHLCGKVMGGSCIMLQSYEPLGGGFTLPQSLHACKLFKGIVMAG